MQVELVLVMVQVENTIIHLMRLLKMIMIEFSWVELRLAGSMAEVL